MEYTQTTAALISSIILLLPLLVYANGAAKNCTASDPSCIDNIKSINKNNNGNKDRKSEARDKYGLVPPFLGAASAVIIIYIVSHCLYLHCYAKKKMKRMVQHNATMHSQTPATIVMTDHPSSASMQPMTPLVKYEGAYGKTEVLQPQPYFMRSYSTQSQCQGQGQKDLSPGGTTGSEGKQLFQTPPSPKPVEIIKSGAKRTSSLLSSITSRSSKKSSSRMSTSSIGTDIISMGLNEQEALLKAQRCSLDQGMAPAMRTNVCFVPLGKTVSEIQSNESSEWIPVQGYIYNPKGQENGNLNSSLSSLQNFASQIVFIPTTQTPRISTAENIQEEVIPIAVDTCVSSGNLGNTEMEVFPEESESKEENNENESLVKEEKEVACEADSPSDTEAQPPKMENITVEVHNSPAAVGT